MEFANKMARFLEIYPRPPDYPQKTATEIFKADLKKVRFADCNEHEPGNPDYKGCNHPEDADEFHPDGGPAVGRVNHTRGKEQKFDLSQINLGDLFAGVCYPTYNSYYVGVHTEEDIPDRLRICMTKADERVLSAKIPTELENQIMLRVRALNQTLFMNLNDVAKSIVIFTKYGLAVGGATEKNVNFALHPIKHLTCLLGLTYRSATTTLQSGYNILYPTSSNASSSNGEIQSETSPYTNTDHIKPSSKENGQVEQLLPLPILREKTYIDDGEAETKKIRSLLAVCNTRVVAVEYLCEGLFVGVVGFDLLKYLPEPDKEPDVSEAGLTAKKAQDEEKERLLNELEEWTTNFAAFLRQELKDFRMEIAR